MPNGMYGGVRGRKTKVGRKLLLFSSYSIIRNRRHTFLAKNEQIESLKVRTICFLEKTPYLCNPNWYVEITINNIENEKNISTVQQKKKEQAWLPFKNGYG